MSKRDLSFRQRTRAGAGGVLDVRVGGVGELTVGRPRLAALLTLVGIGLFSASALAEEPRKVTEPNVLSEPSEITNVVDAFDGDDQFDLSLTLGYQQTWKSAKIRRETFIDQSGLAGGGYTATGLNVAEYSESTARLNTKAEIGIFKDLALIIRLPIILSNDRELKSLEGSDKQAAIAAQGEPGEQLFTIPFKSPTRSGIEYLAVGLDFGIMNQFRDATKPTWVFGFEGRFNVSEPMHACNESTSGLNLPGTKQVKCAQPNDIDRDGTAGEDEYVDDLPSTGPVQLDGTKSGTRQAGVSRGTTALEVHTYLSKRIKYIEPYGGFKALFEFQNESSDYGQTDLKGSLVNHPPLRGTIVMGLNVIPWEVRDQFQRVALDFRFSGTYVSEGRDYSELFDALGSSDAPSLRYPNFAEYQAGPDGVPSTVNPASQKVYFTGLTDVQQHGEYRLSADFVWQAGEYVKFNVGGAYTIVQSHLISFDQPCNPDFSDDPAKAGPCRRSGSPGSAPVATGIPNPNYRAPINVPGRRFKVDGSDAFEAWLNATVMF
ncbi:MAG: hypothetical protein KC766_15430 [Myxococcales bacterium]|nr:hypothetical protein [Myxococcales bacterium]